MDPLLDAVNRHASAHPVDGAIHATAIPGLTTVHATAPSGLQHAVAHPLVCLVLQGRKRMTTATHEVTFAAGDTLLVSADVPTVSQIVDASPAAPYVALALDLDPAVIVELVIEMGDAPTDHRATVQVQPTDMEVGDVALRLMRLLDRPAAAPVLHRPLVRELHYWLLAGRHGPAMRRLGHTDGPARRIANAVAALRAGFTEPWSVQQLAAVAGMSASSFHQHFRTATSLSPLQFQKQLRLIEARRLMVATGATASSAAFAVGYESVPQFTREYGRMFGRSPARDSDAVRARATA